MYKEKLLILLEGALMAAIATVLSAVVPTVEWFDISLGIIPIVIFSIRRGLKAGLLSGLLWGFSLSWHRCRCFRKKSRSNICIILIRYFYSLEILL